MQRPVLVAVDDLFFLTKIETAARQVGVSPRTLCRWFAARAFPERQRRTGETSCLDPYTPMLHQQWDAGCRNATHLWRTLRAQGFFELRER